MKILLTVIAASLLAVPARAQSLTYATISTATYSSVFASSQTPTRVDDRNTGVAGQILPNRNEIILSVPASGKANCGYDVTVSTIPPSLTVSSPHYGTEYTAGVYTIKLPTNMGFWCLSASVSAGQALSVQQLSPWKPGSRSIPGSP